MSEIEFFFNYAPLRSAHFMWTRESAQCRFDEEKKNKTHWILKTNETEIVSFLNNFNRDFMKFHY